MRRTNLLESLSDNIIVDLAKCVFCGECVEVCVLDNLRMRLAPCRSACPLRVNCQGYIQLIARGDEEKAFQVLMRTLPFPGILARVCTAPCESACHRKVITGEAVAIRTLKRYLVDSMDEKNRPVPEPGTDSGKKVAIVGSGPAGLMAAFELRMRGHAVTIFEADREPGGMLRWAIPEFNLPARAVVEEIALLEKMGAVVKCGVKIGKDKSLDDLKREFDAVIIAAGCSGHARLHIEGEDLDGVYHGAPLLKAVRSGKAPKLSGTVVVIGGGNVALDVARTALRLGAEKARVVSLETEGELPAFRKIVETAVAEGVILDHSWGPVRIKGQNGKATAIELQRCLGVLDENGKFSPRFDSCERKAVEADHVVVAIGLKPEHIHVGTDPNDNPPVEAGPCALGPEDLNACRPNESIWLPQPNREMTDKESTNSCHSREGGNPNFPQTVHSGATPFCHSREGGNPVFDPVTLATPDSKVFLAGDYASGPSSVVEAMASGRVSAESVDRYLRGKHLGYGRSFAGPIETEFEIDTSQASELGRIEVPLRRCKGKGDFSEVSGSFAKDQATAEASRCYSCGSPFGKYRTCWFCLPCEVECPEKALRVEIPYLLR